MALLSGGIAGIFGRAFAGLYLDGRLIQRILADDGLGNVSAVERPPIAIKYQIDRLTETQRSAPDYRATDIRVLVLHDGNAIDDACILLLDGKQYRVAPGIAVDAAESHYDIRAVLQ